MKKLVFFLSCFALFAVQFMLLKPQLSASLPWLSQITAAGAVAAQGHVIGSLTELSASDALQALRLRRLTSAEYAGALLQRADRLEDLNVFISRDSAAVLAAARTADQRRERYFRGRLNGLPIIVKDNINSANLPTTGGTPGLRQNQPARNAVVLQRLLNEGAILMGKSNMHELAFGATNNNPATGAVHNPYAFDKIPGGSSGGTAAAIAARIVPVGLGTDTAGSVRVPASLTGTVGFRPSAGRYSRDGIILISETQDRVGTMARNVRDIVLLDSVLSEVGSQVSPAPLKGLRLGVDRANFVADADPAVAALFEAALAKLQSQGVEIVEVNILPAAQFAGMITALRFSIGFYEAPTNLARYLQNINPPLTVQELASQVASPDVRGLFANFLVPGAPMAVSPAAYQAGLTTRDNLRNAYRTVMTENRLAGMIFPTTLLPARPIGQDATVMHNGRIAPTTLIYTQNVVPASYAGLAGLSLPMGLTPDGLPVGLEIDGLEGSDETVLGIGLSLESVLGRLSPPLP